MNPNQITGFFNHDSGCSVGYRKNPVTEFDTIVTDIFLEPVRDFLSQLRELKKTREQANNLVIGQPPSDSMIDVVKQGLDKAGGLFNKLTGIGESAGEFLQKVEPLVTKAVSIIASMRSLFGIP